MPDSLINKPIKTESKPVASKLKGSEVLENSQNNKQGSFFSFCDYLDKSAAAISDRVASDVESTVKTGVDGVVSATKDVGASVAAIDKKIVGTVAQAAETTAIDFDAAKKDIGKVARNVYGNLHKDAERTVKDIDRGAKIVAIDIEKSARVAQNVFIGAG